LLSLYIVFIDVLIYSAAHLQECLINLLTYLLISSCLASLYLYIHAMNMVNSLNQCFTTATFFLLLLLARPTRGLKSCLWTFYRSFWEAAST